MLNGRPELGPSKPSDAVSTSQSGWLIFSLNDDIRADVRIINQLKYAKMIASARLGQLMPRGGPGRGKKNRLALGDFNKNTISTFRKLVDNFNSFDQTCRGFN